MLKSNKVKVVIGCTNTNEVVFEVSLGIYPIPASSLLNVNFKDQPSKKLEVYIVDASGKMVFKEVPKNFGRTYNHRINIEHLAPGNYLVKFLKIKEII